MKIFLVDNNEKFRESLKFYIEGYLHHEVVGEASDEAGLYGCDDFVADIILVDVSKVVLFNNKITNKVRMVGCKKIALSHYRELMDEQALINAGFKGFVSKEFIHRDLENAINAVAYGKLFYPNAT